MTFDWKKPTAQMLGRWQPWHDGHTELFKRAIAKTGQVAILVRDVQGVGDNPFEFSKVVVGIRNELDKHDYRMGADYIVMKVPNITNITYGRDVGYKIEEIVLEDDIQKISATKIREEMRKDGRL